MQLSVIIVINGLLAIAWWIKPMTQIGFDSQALGVASVSTEGTYVGGPVSPDGFPLMVRRKFIGDASPKVVRLANIYRVPRVERSGLTKDVDTRNGIKDRPERMQVECVFQPAFSRPNDGRLLMLVDVL
jgi:hypothetical protein